MEVKGIILAGGIGTRLWPATESVVKQLLPVYDKPMIYYPLTTLMSVGIREFMLICREHDRLRYQRLLGDGRELGISIRYGIQNEPKGIAQAVTIADDCCFLRDCSAIALILGDNLFAGEVVKSQVSAVLRAQSAFRDKAATVFVTEVRDPERYGVAVFSDQRVDNELVDIVEKPLTAPSNWAVTGLYIYPPDAPERVRQQKPSTRGELEITDLNRSYLRNGNMLCNRLGRGVAWLDTGTPEALLQASQYVQTIQERHGIMLGCPEEAAFDNRWIMADDLERRASHYRNAYGDYLRSLIRSG